MARPGKTPTTALHHQTVGLLTASIQTGGRVRCRTIRRRTIRRRQHPHLSHWRSGGVVIPLTHVGRVSLIYTGGASSSHRTLPNIGWPVQTGRTIHLNNKLHGYPSRDILINPSTDRIHHYLYTIVHICGTNKEQFTIPEIPNNTL